MRVTVIPTITQYPWGAPGHCMGELVKELRAAQHQVQWFVAPIDTDHPCVREAHQGGVRICRLPDEPKNYRRLTKLRHRLDKALRGESFLQEQVSRFSPDFLFINQGGTWCGTYGQYAKALATMQQKYAVITHLNSHAEGSRTIADIKARRDLIRHAKAIYFPSKWCRDIAELQIAAPIDNARLFSYPHRYDPEVLDWPESSSIARIAFVGRLDSFHKGLDLGLQALKIAKQAGHRFAFTLYGRGNDFNYLESLVHHFALKDEVHFAGYTDDIRSVWLQNEILFLPSRMEGCAVALTEAMSFGRPVITTTVGGGPEWIEDGETGYLALAPNTDLISAKLIAALQSRDQWLKMGFRAYKKIARLLPPRPASSFLACIS